MWVAVPHFLPRISYFPHSVASQYQPAALTLRCCAGDVHSIFIFQMKKLRPSEVQWAAQGHTVNLEYSWVQDRGAMVLVGGHDIFFLCDYQKKTVGKKLRNNPFALSVVRWRSFSVSLLGGGNPWVLWELEGVLEFGYNKVKDFLCSYWMPASRDSSYHGPGIFCRGQLCAQPERWWA